MTTFLLVDASSYLFRAYYALPDLRSTRDFPTGAIWGVLTMLRRLRQDYPTTYGACVFDTPGGNFRHALYPEYKANRGQMPADLSIQVPVVLTITRLLGWPVIQCPGYEADDVIATLVHQAQAQSYHCVISTGDKDLAQLVSPDVHLINTMTAERLDPEGVVKKFGLAPERIADYLVLMGDRIDNIPGVPGVGPKTAVKWLTQYGSLDEVIAHADEIPGKVGAALRDHIPMFDQVRQLVCLNTAVPLPTVCVTDYMLQPEEHDALQQQYRELSFARLYDRDMPATGLLTSVSASCQTLSAWSTSVSSAVLHALDEGSYGVLWGDAFYFFESVDADLDAAVWERLSRVHLIVHDAKRCCCLFPRFAACNYDDVMLQSYVMHSDQESALPALAEQLSLVWRADIGPADQLAQACTVIRSAYEQFAPRISAIGAEVVYRLECRVARVLAAMEREGIALDVHLLADYEQHLRHDIAGTETAAYGHAGHTLNLASPKQLQTVLFDEMALPVVKKTAKGLRSTDEEVLAALAPQSPFAALVLTHRTLTKMLNTYVHKLPTCVREDTGRIHTVFLQTGTVTGRLSSINPNLQNIPVKGVRTVRDAFIPRSGYALISADYSQIELRILAHFSEDEALCAAFASGLDIHGSTAQHIFHHASIDAVTSEERRFAKTLNFGLLYGMSAFGVAKQLRISQEEAAHFIEQYFASFPSVRAYMAAIRAKAREQGYVETILGRRVYLKDIHHNNMHLRQAAERSAINGPMQGSAADIIKLAMCAVADVLTSDQYLILQVHDELLIEAPLALADQVAAQVAEAMKNCITLRVPLVVNVGVGAHWGAIH